MKNGERNTGKSNTQRLIRNMNLDCIDPFYLCGTFDIPEVQRVNDVPQKLIPFHQVKSFRGTRAEMGVHFFIDDYQFERVWNNPERYAKMLQGFACVLSPDFSMYADMPLAMQIWNHYRKMAIGQFFQSHKIAVVPTLNWSTEESFAFCFDGVPKGGTVAVSSVGCCNCENVRKLWTRGMNEAMRKLKPERVFFYGAPIEFEKLGAEVLFFQPEHLVKVRKRREKNEVGERTKWLVENPAIVCYVAEKIGVPKCEWEDFQQEVILRSLELREVFDPAKAKISTWATGFVFRIGREFQRKMRTLNGEK
ncbi:MAG: DUF4417 domain-containing protein [Planctomycetia bacterium]|nr:DUF4417 domain-containing protein [Planctomycetia bacterium]